MLFYCIIQDEKKENFISLTTASDDEFEDIALVELIKNIPSSKQESHYLSVMVEEEENSLDETGKKAEVSLSNFEAAASETETSDVTYCKTLLSIFLCNPQDFEQKSKPSGVKENFICTL